VVRGSEAETFHLHGEAILIATGSQPHRPPEIPFDDVVIFDSDSILKMDRIPRSLAVVGGGVIGCEYASIFTALGVEVTLVDGRDRLLPFLDDDLSDCLRDRLANLGVKFFLGERLGPVERAKEGVRVQTASGKIIDADSVLFAAGRRGAVDQLHLEKAGLAVNKRGYVEVNSSYQASVPSIYAAGDVIGFPALASTSMEQGRVAVCHAFGFQYKQRVASMLPMGVYTIPEISAVGETEQSCKEKGIEYEVGRARYSNNARGMIAGDSHGLLKLLFRRTDRQLLGVHIIGESATELIHMGMMAIEAGGTIDLFIDFVFNYPTLSEMYKYAAYDGLGNLSGHKLRQG
jgi:NAD(P) transhydrogenase